MFTRVPARVVWATTIVAARSPSRILEIGHGRGVAIERLTGLLPDAHINGIDRSPIAFEAAVQRNRHAIESGRVSLQHGDFATANVGGRFEIIFAINVNVFWATHASRELGWLQHCLAPSGLLYLIYEPPSNAQGIRIEAELPKNLLREGFPIEEVLRADLGANEGLCIIASSQ